LNSLQLFFAAGRMKLPAPCSREHSTPCCREHVEREREREEKKEKREEKKKKKKNMNLSHIKY
jgi:hypothetical protein